MYDGGLPFDTDFMEFAAPKPLPVERFLSLIYPLDPFVWLLVLISYISAGLVFWIIANVEGRLTNNFFRWVYYYPIYISFNRIRFHSIISFSIIINIQTFFSKGMGRIKKRILVCIRNSTWWIYNPGHKFITSSWIKVRKIYSLITNTFQWYKKTWDKKRMNTLIAIIVFQGCNRRMDFVLLGYRRVVYWQSKSILDYPDSNKTN